MEARGGHPASALGPLLATHPGDGVLARSQIGRRHQEQVSQSGCAAGEDSGGA